MNQIARIREELSARGLDALLITDEKNQRYTAGFPFTDGAVLVGKEKAFLITTGVSQGALMYILSLREFQHDFYQDNDLRVLGIAKTRSEARGIVLRLVEEAGQAGALWDMKSFLEEY